MGNEIFKEGWSKEAYFFYCAVISLIDLDYIG